MKLQKFFIFILLITGVFVQSCSDQPTTLSDKKQKLQDYRSKVNDLQAKITKLEKAIQKSDTTASEESRLVNLAPVKQRTFKNFVEVSGEATSKKNVKVSPERSGIIKKIHYSEGDTVKKGSLLAKLESETIERQIEKINTNLSHARKLYRRQKNLWRKDIGSEVEYLQAKNRVQNLEKQLASVKSQLANTKITSPIDGEIDEIFFNEGEMANPASPLCRVVNLREMRVVSNVSESYLGKIRKGDSITVHFPNIGIKRRTVVNHVGQFINPESRTFKVEIKLDNKNRLIKPNVLATIRFSNYQNPDALVIPTKILQESDSGTFIFTAQEASEQLKAKKTLIETGKSYQGFTEVLEGLTKNDRFVLKGFRKVADGENIKLPN